MYLNLGIFLLILLIGLLSYTRIWLSTRTYVGVSQIQGEGLFANQSFKRGDVILEDIFPHRHPDQVLYDSLPPTTFSNIISYEGSKINHCGRRYNSDVTTTDYHKLQLVAIKDISPDQEITANYDRVNQKFPFIAKSSTSYATC